MIDRRDINEYLGLYPWNSEEMTIDLEDNIIEKIIDKTIDRIIWTPEGREFLEYLRGRKNAVMHVTEQSEVWVYPDSEEELREFLKKEVSKENFVQVGIVGFLIGDLFAEPVIEELLRMEESGVDPEKEKELIKYLSDLPQRISKKTKDSIIDDPRLDEITVLEDLHELDKLIYKDIENESIGFNRRTE